MFGLKLAKSANICKTNFFAKILYGYHKMQNWMLSLNHLKKIKKIHPKEVIKQKFLRTVKKSKTPFFSVTFLLLTFSHI
jgi:hypothetical protein